MRIVFAFGLMSSWHRLPACADRTLSRMRHTCRLRAARNKLAAMSLYYYHLLIAQNKEFSPAPAQIEAFGKALDSLGVVPPPLTINLWTESNRSRTVHDPFSAKDIAFQERVRHSLPTLGSIQTAIAGLVDYELCISGQGRPRTPPLPIVFDGPYHVAVTIERHSQLRSTSYCYGTSQSVSSISAIAHPFLAVICVDVG